MGAGISPMAVQLSLASRKSLTSMYKAIKFSEYTFSPIVLSGLYGPFYLRAVEWGMIFDATGSYQWAFLLFAAMAAVSGLVYILLPSAAHPTSHPFLRSNL
jgi:hypothetical protein